MEEVARSDIKFSGIKGRMTERVFLETVSSSIHSLSQGINRSSYHVWFG